MKLLYCAPHQLWPPNTDARLRDYQLARRLAARCEVTFIEMLQAVKEARTPAGATDLANIVTLNKSQSYGPSKVLRGLAGPIPVTVLNCWSPQLASEVRHLLQSRKFDTVQIETIVLMSERERQMLLSRRPTADIRVIPNGIDVSYYSSDQNARACHTAGNGKSMRRFFL